MRALVTRGVRPRISSASTTTFPSITSPARQAIFPPTRRKLTFSDAFTILLAPVFAFAFVADTTQKDKRRRAWDDKIAEVREEIEAIRERELRSWNTVQLRSVQVGARYQRRGYTTAARAMQPEESSEYNVRETHNQEYDERAQQDRPGKVTQTETATVEPESIDRIGRRRESIFDPRVLANWQQYEALLASKLALELLLHIRTGKSWLYRQPTEILIDSELFPESLDDLMIQLHRVNDALKQVNSKKRPGEVPHRLLAIPDRDLLHDNIASLAKACKEGKITVVQLVYGYASAIGGSKTAPKSTSYRAMMDAFLTLDNESLAYTTMSALQNCQQRLNNADIGTMLFQYGHFKDGGRLSSFLRLLVKREASCILRLTTPWEHVFVNGVRVPTPVDRNARLIATSIKTALQCGMVQQAEAWTTILFQTGDREQLGSVMRHIITHYTEHCDWTYGSKWLQEITKRAALIADENAGELSKCIMRMFELCVACNKPEMYERLMNAVLIAGIRPEVVNTSRPEFYSERISSIRRDWTMRQKTSVALKKDSAKQDSCIEQAIRFQQVLMQDDPILKSYVGITSGREITAKTSSGEVEDSEGDRFRPFHTPFQLLGGTQAHSQPSKERGSKFKQGRAIETEPPIDEQKQSADKQRIVELETQLAESQKCNTELLEKVNNQINKIQKPEPQIQNTGRRESRLSHLHLLADHQRLVQEHGDLQATYQTLLKTQAMHTHQNQHQSPLQIQYATVSPIANITSVPKQTRQYSTKKAERTHFRSVHVSA